MNTKKKFKAHINIIPKKAITNIPANSFDPRWKVNFLFDVLH